MYLFCLIFFSFSCFLFCFVYFTFCCCWKTTQFRFEIPGVVQGIRLSHEFPNKNAEYKYFGRGLNEGECGVSIEQVKPANNGKVKCILGLAEDEATGEVELTVACKYTLNITSQTLDGIHFLFATNFHLNIWFLLSFRRYANYTRNFFSSNFFFGQNRVFQWPNEQIYIDFEREKNKWWKKNGIVTVSIFFRGIISFLLHLFRARILILIWLEFHFFFSFWIGNEISNWLCERKFINFDSLVQSHLIRWFLKPNANK